MAIENILNNVERLVQKPSTEVAHLSDLAVAEAEFKPHAIVLSGTLRDFDFYRPEILERFGRFIRTTPTPVLAICGGHQLVGLSFGAHVVTLDGLEQHEQRDNRPQEYQYRFIRITDSSDPIFRRSFGRSTRKRLASFVSGKTTACNSTECRTDSSCWPRHISAGIR